MNVATQCPFWALFFSRSVTQSWGSWSASPPPIAHSLLQHLHHNCPGGLLKEIAECYPDLLGQNLRGEH